MTDNKIIKALECCSNNVLYEQCVDCPYKEYLEKGHTCIIKATKNALDLINRQKAEIERLQDVNIRLTKAEAIKEFAERLEPKLANNTDISAVGYQSIVEVVDNLVKEMVGDLNE